MRILYAAANSVESQSRLLRFLRAAQHSTHLIKVAAFRSSAGYLRVDWSLDALLDPKYPERLSLDSDAIKVYRQQVQYFKPDLIISDMEVFTTEIAMACGIPFWLLGSWLAYWAIKQDTMRLKNAADTYPVFKRKDSLHLKFLAHAFANADRNLVYSHLGDLPRAPTLKEGCEWVRPYHHRGSSNPLCQHQFVAVSANLPKRFMHRLQQYPDLVCFTHSQAERFAVPLKDLDNEMEYQCNIANAGAAVCQGEADILADAFYNGVPALIVPEFQDPALLFGAILTEKYQLGQIMYDPSLPLDLPTITTPTSNPQIGLLHEILP
jgi:hypothetical protein